MINCSGKICVIVATVGRILLKRLQLDNVVISCLLSVATLSGYPLRPSCKIYLRDKFHCEFHLACVFNSGRYGVVSNNIEIQVLQRVREISGGDALGEEGSSARSPEELPGPPSSYFAINFSNFNWRRDWQRYHAARCRPLRGGVCFCFGVAHAMHARASPELFSAAISFRVLLSTRDVSRTLGFIALRELAVIVSKRAHRHRAFVSPHVPNLWFKSTCDSCTGTFLLITYLIISLPHEASKNTCGTCFIENFAINFCSRRISRDSVIIDYLFILCLYFRDRMFQGKNLLKYIKNKIYLCSIGIKSTFI